MIRVLRSAVVVFMVLLASCQAAPVGTEVVVVVDSELIAGEELSKLEILVLDRSGEGPPLRRLSLPLSANQEQSSQGLPLSFSVAPESQDDAREFRLVVTGHGQLAAGEEQRPLVEQQMIARFQPGSARRLDVFLARACADQLCWEGSRRGDRTCDAEGSCGEVPVHASLPPVGHGALAGYEPRSITQDAGEAPSSEGRDGGAGEDGGKLDGSSTGALDGSIGDGSTGSEPKSDAGSEPKSDASVAPGPSCTPDPCMGMRNKSCDAKSGRCVCNHQCEAPELTRCTGGMLSVCKADADGCRDWMPLQTCPLGCGDAVSCAGCTNECPEPGRGECGTNSVRLCGANAAGCLVLGEPISCADQLPCTNDRCNAQTGRCEHTPNDQACTAHSGNPCVRDYCDANLGCLSENTTASCNDNVACTTGDVCGGGVCAGTADPSCGDLCPADPNKTAPLTCGCGVAEQTGDRDHDGTIDCLDSCPDDQCATAGVSCSAGMVRSCTANAMGCRSLAQRTCTDGACYDATRCTRTTVYKWAASEAVFVYAVAADAQGNAYATGMSTSAVGSAQPLGGQDMFVSKWGPNGQRLWDVTWGSDLSEWAYDIAVSSAGDRVAIGGSVNGVIGVRVGSTASAGPPLWTTTLPATSVPVPNLYGQVQGVVFGPGGDVYVAGRVTLGALPGQTNAGMAGQSNVSTHDAFAMRLNAATGAVVWGIQWGTANGDGAYDIASDGTNLYVAGVRNYLAENDTTSGDAFLRKLNANGALQWERVIDNGQRDWGKAVAVDASGNAVLAATSYRSQSQGLLMRISSANVVQWTENIVIKDDVELDAAGNAYAINFAYLSKHNSGSEIWSFAHVPAGQYTSDLAIYENATVGVRVYGVGFDNSGATPRGFFAVTGME